MHIVALKSPDFRDHRSVIHPDTVLKIAALKGITFSFELGIGSGINVSDQTFIDLGLKIPGGSDCPIETGNPLFEFYAAVTRQNHQGLPKGGWQPQEKISKNNALKMFTTWAAYGGFDENRRGKIKVGFDADLTILSKNLLTSDNSEILNTKIIGTIVNGEFVYDKL